MSFKCWQEVINDYEKLLENEEGCDVIIYAGENENEKIHVLGLNTFVLHYLKMTLKKRIENHF